MYEEGKWEDVCGRRENVTNEKVAANESGKSRDDDDDDDNDSVGGP